MLPKIKIIGIGGAGGNTLSRIANYPLKGVEKIAVNTDAQELIKVKSAKKILFGQEITGGLGTGMDWRLGKKIFLQEKEKIKEILAGANLVFLTGGLGGGTATFGLSIFGEISKEIADLTLTICTLPFSFEGKYRQKIAKIGLKTLEKKVDSLICLPNDRILKISPPETKVEKAFEKVDQVLLDSISSILSFFHQGGPITLDFSDLKTILKNSGRAFFGIGKAKGENRIIKASSSALKSPLIEFPIKEPKGLLFNISGKEDLTLSEINSAANFLKKTASEKTKVIFGVTEEPSLEKGEVKVTVIVTGDS